MNFLIAPDSFKESLTSPQVASAIKKGIQKVFPEAEFDLLPIGDGGEGTMNALVNSLMMNQREHIVSGPFGEEIKASYGYFGKTAIFEIAEIVGIQKIPPAKRKPLEISTLGVGQMLVHLAENKFENIIIGVGGSASNDGGIGLASGLGYTFFDNVGNELDALGINLSLVDSYKKNTPEVLNNLQITVITDVNNELCGPQGATYIFGPQKGLEKSQLREVDLAMKSFYTLVNSKAIKTPGSGAGGGLAASLMTFLPGHIESGIDYVLDLVAFEKHAAKADIVIVGEGKIDGQSMAGKAPVGIAKRVPVGTPVIAICGSIGEEVEKANYYGIDAVFSVLREVEDLETVLQKAEENLEYAAKNIAALIKVSQKIQGC